MLLLGDVEANGLEPTKIHCIATQEYPKGSKNLFTSTKLFEEYYLDTKPKKSFWHNGLGYDVKVINRLIKPNLIDPKTVVDTMVVSKTTNYSKFSTHSLKELGEYLKVYKGDYDGGWDEYTPKMGLYCEQDVEVLKAIVDHYWKYIIDPDWSDAFRLEHDIAILCDEMHFNGFLFNRSKAKSLLKDVKDKMGRLEKAFKAEFDSKLEEVKRLKLRYKADGTLFSTVQAAIDTYPKVVFDTDTHEAIVYDYIEFDPASPKKRIDVLWDAGWKPFEKTKGHIQAERSNRR